MIKSRGGGGPSAPNVSSKSSLQGYFSQHRLHSEAGSLQVAFSGGSRLVLFTSNTCGGGGSIFPTLILNLTWG